MNKSVAIPDNTFLDDLHPARFLRVTDLTERWKVARLLVKISRLQYEETVPKTTDIDPQTHKPRIVMQPVMYFFTKDGNEYPRPYLLSAKVDLQSLKTATGCCTAGELKGRTVVIMVGRHKEKPVLRIDPKEAEHG